MTKFEQVGVNIQNESSTRKIAQYRFSRSCELCYCKGMHIECDRCCIAVAHKRVIENFETMEVK